VAITLLKKKQTAGGFTLPVTVRPAELSFLVAPAQQAAGPRVSESMTSRL